MKTKMQSEESAGITSGAEVTFGPLVETCLRFGIKRGQAFSLAREKRIVTFVIGRKRFAVIESIKALASKAVQNV